MYVSGFVFIPEKYSTKARHANTDKEELWHCMLNPNGQRTATLLPCLLSGGSVHTNRTTTQDAVLTVYSVRSTPAHAVTMSPTRLPYMNQFWLWGRLQPMIRGPVCYLMAGFNVSFSTVRFTSVVNNNVMKHWGSISSWMSLSWFSLTECCNSAHYFTLVHHGRKAEETDDRSWLLQMSQHWRSTASCNWHKAGPTTAICPPTPPLLPFLSIFIWVSISCRSVPAAEGPPLDFSGNQSQSYCGDLFPGSYNEAERSCGESVVMLQSSNSEAAGSSPWMHQDECPA